MEHKVIIGDAVRVLDGLQSNSVQLVVTSPPYWNIKDYEVEGQIGYNQSINCYLLSLRHVWEGCFYALSSGCKLCINIGDQYVRASDNNGIYEILPLHSWTVQSCLQNLDFTYLGSIIWKKISTTKPTGGCSWMGSIYYPRDGYITYEHEYIAIFKKPGKALKPTEENKELSKLTKEQRTKWFRGIWEDIKPTIQEEHPATFPIELPERLIRMYTFCGETVLDPFVGSGTTMEAAEKSGRNSIGIDINKSYLPIIKQKVPDCIIEGA